MFKSRTLSFQSGQQIWIEGSFIQIGLPDFDFGAVTRFVLVADYQCDFGRIVDTGRQLSAACINLPVG